MQCRSACKGTGMTDLVLNTLLSSLFIGIFYGLVGIGLTISFGVLRLLNIAHGDFIMLGAFGAFWLHELFGLSVFASGPLIVAPLAFAIGLCLYPLLVRRLEKFKDPEAVSLLVMFGLSVFLANAAALFWGTSVRGIVAPLPISRIDVLGQTVPAGWIAAAIVGLLTITAMLLVLKYSRLGRSIRAIMQSSQLSAAVGIDVQRITAISFAISVALAAFAGAMLPLVSPAISSSMGMRYTIVAFTVVILGSIGKPMGALLGGIIFSEVLGISNILLPPSQAQLVAYGLLLLVIYFRPQGVLGHA